MTLGKKLYENIRKQEDLEWWAEKEKREALRIARMERSFKRNSMLEKVTQDIAGQIEKGQRPKVVISEDLDWVLKCSKIDPRYGEPVGVEDYQIWKSFVESLQIEELSLTVTKPEFGTQITGLQLNVDTLYREEKVA